MTEELKPCPFCGSSAGIVTGTYHGERKFWKAYCKNCQCRTWCEFTRANAVNVWNTRHVSEGYALVPVEPTRVMREAFHDSYEDYENGDASCPDAQWKAMIAAAQEQSNDTGTA